jgi:hypothetical protein
VALCIWCVCGVHPAAAQKLIVTLKLDGDQIGLVSTTQGLTTRLAFPDSVKEVICGDLYDPASGKGTFVVQRSDNDVFIKPITSKGASNLFVRTGDKLHRIYNFDLSIVSFDKAYRVVNVESESAATQPVADANQAGSAEASKATDDSLKDARAQADEIVRTARQQASMMVAEAQQSVDEMQRHAIVEAPQQVQRRFVSALLGGLNTTRISNAQVATQKKVIIRLDKEMYTFEACTYMRYTIQNSGKENFVYAEIRLEAGATAAGQKHVPAEVIQSKPENKVVPGETVAGILVFDQKLANPKDKLVLSVQGKDDNTLTHIVVLQ